MFPISKDTFRDIINRDMSRDTKDKFLVVKQVNYFLVKIYNEDKAFYMQKLEALSNLCGVRRINIYSTRARWIWSDKYP